jgi:hypothetical protein
MRSIDRSIEIEKREEREGREERERDPVRGDTD